MTENKNQLHIEHNTVQETLVIPLYARKICSDRYPQFFKDEEAERLISMLDYDFAEKGAKMQSFAGNFGALEVAQRQYDLSCEVEAYLKEHPKAAVVNLGCGLDTTFSRVDNGQCRGFNLDLPGVIEVREQLLPSSDREKNIACDLNDFAWFDAVDPDGALAKSPQEGGDGAVFFAAGVFYYFKTEEIKALLTAMAERFPGAVIAFDACNERGLKMMLKTWVKEAGITDVGAFFSVRDAKAELAGWSDRFASVTSRGYMKGYRDLGKAIPWLYRRMCSLCDGFISMQIVRIAFAE